MAWPESPTIEASTARWVPQHQVRHGHGIPPGTPREVVPVLAEWCPDCHTPTVAVVARMDALFRHGGYGATMRTTRRYCPACSWSLVVELEEERPPR